MMRSASFVVLLTSATGCVLEQPEIVADEALHPCENAPGRATSDDLPLSTDASVRTAYARATGDAADLVATLCIHRGLGHRDIDGSVIVVARRATDGCRFQGVFYRGSYHPGVQAVTRRFLNDRSWSSAPDSIKTALAVTWTSEVLLHFDGVLSEAPSDFALPDAPAFDAPTARIAENGAVLVKAWVHEPMSWPRAYHVELLRIDPVGTPSKIGVGSFFSARRTAARR